MIDDSVLTEHAGIGQGNFKNAPSKWATVETIVLEFFSWKNLTLLFFLKDKINDKKC